MVSIYNYVNPIVALLLGWFFYRERIGMREIAAMLVIFAGVALVKRYGQRSPRKPIDSPFQRRFDFLNLGEDGLEKIADSFEAVQRIVDVELRRFETGLALRTNRAASRPERPDRRAARKARRWFWRSRSADNRNRLCLFCAARPCAAW